MRILLHHRVSGWLYLFFLLAGCGDGLLGPTLAADRVPSDAPQRLSAEGEAELRAMVEAGNLPDLRRPGFVEYRFEVKEFYQESGYALAWVKGYGASDQAKTLIQALENADLKGLHAEDYDGRRWRARLAQLQQTNPSPSDDTLARFDVALTVSLMRYVSDLHVGRVNPHLFHFGLDIDKHQYDLSRFLREKLVDAKDVKAVMEEIEPPFPAYRRTVSALQTYLKLAGQDNGEPLPAPSKDLKPGNSYPGLPRLCRLLRLLGDLSPDALGPADGIIYEGPIVDAMKHFQRRHGLEPDGRIDSHTFKELNTPVSRRVLQLQLTLERWRWLPHQFGQPPIVVNIPEFRLHADNAEYRWVLSMKVVVGRAYRHRTPVFASEMKYVIFRPYWNVPLSIQRAELVPKLAKHPRYLDGDYEVVRNGKAVNEVLTTATLEQLRSGKLALRQKPGLKNALGLVKFVFPNEHDVYLHDTPSKELFSKSRRDFSHGCIRVEEPVELAAWVLRDKPEWTVDRIRAVMNGEKTVTVMLENPIPVLILYGTAVVMEDGEVRFFDDVYGHDAALDRALARSYPYPH